MGINRYFPSINFNLLASQKPLNSILIKYLTKLKPRETPGFFLYNKILPPHKPIILQEHCTVCEKIFS